MFASQSVSSSNLLWFFVLALVHIPWLDSVNLVVTFSHCDFMSLRRSIANLQVPGPESEHVCKCCPPAQSSNKVGVVQTGMMVFPLVKTPSLYANVEVKHFIYQFATHDLVTRRTDELAKNLC